MSDDGPDSPENTESPENSETPESSDGGGREELSREAKEERDAGGVPDEDLPEDLRADKNPLAADPDDTDDDGSDGASAGGGDGASDGGEKPGPAQGMPDMGQPG